MGAALQLVLVFLLTKFFGAFSAAATPIAVEITVLHNFVWHECFTWGTRGPKSCRHLALRLWRFHARNGLVSLAGKTIVGYFLVGRLHIFAMPAAARANLLWSLSQILIS